MSSRRQLNAIITINVNGSQVEGVDNVKSVVFNHFESNFKSGNIDHPRVKNLNFKS